MSANDVNLDRKRQTQQGRSGVVLATKQVRGCGQEPQSQQVSKCPFQTLVTEVLLTLPAASVKIVVKYLVSLCPQDKIASATSLPQPLERAA